ncbi:MAG: ATP-binding protein [Candidatus Firestonebacteria bacterium]|nr:ATP-binding protein [Candidatus Firestonebacteria bacterium]
MIRNPFRYGEPVTGDYFTNRYREREAIMGELSQGRNVLLTGPRHMGKSSLARRVVSEFERQGVMAVYVDFERAYSVNQFIEIFLAELLRTAFRQAKELQQFIETLSPGLKNILVLKLGKAGELTVEVSRTKNPVNIALTLLSLAQSTAEYKRRVCVVCLDEITPGILPEDFRKGILEVARKQPQVGYLLLNLEQPGSDMREGFVHWPLEKIEERYLRAFIKTRFENTGFRVEEALIDEVLKASWGQAHYVQMICRELWNLGHTSKLVSSKNLPPALESILETHSGFYTAMWRELSTHQKNLLLAIAASGGRKIFSKEFVQRHNLGGFSTVQKSVNRLLEIKVLERIQNTAEFTDVFFKEWLTRRMA